MLLNVETRTHEKNRATPKSLKSRKVKHEKNMKMKTIKFLAFAILIGGLTTMTSCKKEYVKYDNKEIIENSYTGNIELLGTDELNGNFDGNGDSGELSFVWENTGTKADVDFFITSALGGTIQIILNDAKGKKVFNQTRPDGTNNSFSGLSEEGKTGKWLVTIKLTNVDGNGGYDIKPRD